MVSENFYSSTKDLFGYTKSYHTYHGCLHLNSKGLAAGASFRKVVCLESGIPVPFSFILNVICDGDEDRGGPIKPSVTSSQELHSRALCPSPPPPRLIVMEERH